MCGIYGQFSFRNRIGAEDKAECERAVSLMQRRGPDDEGIWTDSESCILGFRRLTILDLTPAGHQPMFTRDGRFALVYNGEVFNYRELREELQNEGFHPRSTGDAEVVLGAIVQWGKKALERFQGMFALAVYDRMEKKLLLARDHAGIKPLYYLLTSHGLVFSSQYDQILSHPWSKQLSISSDGLALYLRMGYIPAPYAILENTFMMEAGSWLQTDCHGNLRQENFFEFPVFPEPDLRGEEAIDAVDDAISRAVKRHLVSDVPVGTFLSGGIDSPLVAAKMKSELADSPLAFTIGVTDPEMDESPDAREYARILGLDHHWEMVTPNQGVSLVEDAVAACGEPLADISIIPSMIVCRQASRHVKVMLSGDGGDELFWGYAGRFNSILRKSADFRQPYLLRSARWGMKKLFNIGNGYWNLRYRSIGQWFREKHSRLTDQNLESIFIQPPEWPESCTLFHYDGWKPEETAQWLRWNEFRGHLTMVLLKIDRASMYYSLEVRVPLLDREVIQIALRTDWESCINMVQDRGKIPLRESLTRHVHYQSQLKRGFDVPLHQWLQGPLRQILEDCLLQRKEILGVNFQRGGIQALADRHWSGETDEAQSLWTLLHLSMWEQKHYRQSSKQFLQSTPV
ncbi:asparagine synthase (glutamine-hydrolyzing) [bacterium]|nr:asparagine synthase (glutamine-hydrolyzing) [bacterium]